MYEVVAEVVCLLIPFSIPCYHKSSGSLLCVEKLNECVSHTEDEIPRADRVPSVEAGGERAVADSGGLQCSQTGAGHTSILVLPKATLYYGQAVGGEILRNLFRPCPLEFLNIILRK